MGWNGEKGEVTALAWRFFFMLRSRRLGLAPRPCNYPFFSWPGECVSVSSVPLLRDSRGTSLGLSGLLGHSFVIMTFDPCSPACREECRRCLPWLRLMVSRWLSLSLSLYFLLSLLSAAEWCEGKALPGVIPVTGDPPAWISSWAQAHLWTDSLGLCQKVSGLSWLEGNERERAIDWPRVWVRSENALVQSSTSQSSPSDSQLSGVARQRGHSVIGNGPPLPAPPPSTSP